MFLVGFFAGVAVILAGCALLLWADVERKDGRR